MCSTVQVASNYYEIKKRRARTKIVVVAERRDEWRKKAFSIYVDIVDWNCTDSGQVFLSKPIETIGENNWLR